MSFPMRMLSARARWSAAGMAAFLWSCGPHHEGGGAGGEAGEGGSTAGSGGLTGGSAGTDAGGSGPAGSAGTALGGTGTAGSGGNGGSGGSGGSGSPGPEPTIGCPAPVWPEAGLYFVVPPPGAGTPAEIRLENFSATSISGDGQVVGGWTRDPESPNPRPVPALFTLAGGATLLPRLQGGLSNEGFAARLSCDGSVALAYDIFGGSLHRVEGSNAPAIISTPPRPTLAMDPGGALVLDGSINFDDPLSGPRVWTAETGAVYLPALGGTELYHVSPDGTFIGSDFEVLFRYDRATGVEQAIGMAPVAGGTSIAFGSSGNAWVQSADQHSDSFLLWQPPAQPRSVTCPDRCLPVDLSSTGEVALFDVYSDESQVPASLVWTKRLGFVDLAALFTQSGLDVGTGRRLHALGMSDDARAFTGVSFNPSVVGDQYFFYGVLPAATYD